MVAMISGGTLRMLERIISAAARSGRSAPDGFSSVPASRLSQASRVRPAAAAFAVSAATSSSDARLLSWNTLYVSTPRLARSQIPKNAHAVRTQEELESKGKASEPFGFESPLILGLRFPPVASGNDIIRIDNGYQFVTLDSSLGKK
jgi:hypothetical protein